MKKQRKVMAMESDVVEEWEKHGRKCKIVKNTFDNGDAHYCGYVTTKLQADYEDIPAQVHGGLSYGVDDDGWVGFDCAHASDVCVDEDGEKISNDAISEQRVWTPEKVRNEVNDLAWRMKRLEEFFDQAEYR